jgi:hypothetical protein
MSVTQTYPFKVLLFLDMFVCALIWRDSSITISSMTGLALLTPVPPRWAHWLGGFLDWLQPGHCAAAIVGDTARANQALEILAGKVSP